MSYTISQVAEKMGVSNHTLRYYDKEGLLPYVERDKSGNRKFKDSDFNWLNLITCLKNTGMSLRQIKKYIDLGMIGKETTDERLKIMKDHQLEVLERIEQLHVNLELINAKITMYEKRLKDEEH